MRSRNLRSRNLLLMTTVVGSALIGTGIAVTGHLYAVMQPELANQPVAQAPSAVPDLVESPVAQSPDAPPTAAQSPMVQTNELFAPPPPSPAPILTAATSDPMASDPIASDPISPLRVQLRRAIQERNLTLLRSLMQAGSLREALRDVETKGQVNFNNLDASTWTVLEKAIDYRCRQAQTNDTACFQ